MNISIIGSGDVGSALAQAFARQNYQVFVGLRNPESAKASTLSKLSENIIVTTLEQAAIASEVTILAIPFDAVENALLAMGDLNGKIVIDATNPLGMTETGYGLTLGFSTSGGEQVAQLAANAHVVKTLNQVGWEVMLHAQSFENSPLMFMAGNDIDAKNKVNLLLTDIGFLAKDAGTIDKSRILEPFAMVWINQAVMQGEGRNFSFSEQLSKAIN
jgi:predicted dinucleotide-binding enzyme